MKHTFKYTSRNSGSSGGHDLFSGPAIVFLVLKLTGTVTWPWVWVLAPIWIPIALVVLALIFYAVKDALENERRFENFRRWCTRTRLKWRKMFCRHDYKKSPFQALSATETQTYVCIKCDKQIEK